MTTEASNPPRLSMRDIRKSFGATIALDGVDFTVGSGEIRALVGENGAGKSTLMKVLSGATQPDSGTMDIDGHPYSPKNAQEARMAGVAMIYQELSLASHLSVEDNVMLGMEVTRFGLLRQQEARTRVRESLNHLGHSNIRLDARLGTLSVASQQIVEIARALAIGSRVLVLDEPTSSLSQEDIERLFLVLRRLKSQGHAIVYISHFIEEVKLVADTFTVLRDGKVAGEGKAAGSTVSEIVGLMVGRRIEELYPHSTRVRGEAILEVHNVAGDRLPRSVDFTLHRGEILGIAGLVGAGRTELLRLLFGLEQVRSGEIRLATYVGPASPAQRWEQGAGLLSEDRAREGLALSMTITDNIVMNLRNDAGWLGLLSPGHLDLKCREWIKRLGIRASGPRQRVGALSGGNQQKVALARLLHEDVDVLLLDEPTRGIDVASKSQIYELVNRLAEGDRVSGRAPKAILIVSSYLPELLGICDRIAVMSRGHLGAARPARECSQHSLMVEATGQGAIS